MLWRYYIICVIHTYLQANYVVNGLLNVLNVKCKYVQYNMQEIIFLKNES